MTRVLRLLYLVTILLIPSDVLASSAFDPAQMPDKERNVFFPPILSLFLPGFDQWVEGQIPYAASYSGTALAGYALSSRAKNIQRRSELSSEDDGVRQGLLGGSLFGIGSGLSAYHSFHTAIQARKNNGQYSFIKEEAEPLEVLASPFRFDYLSRLSTAIPLGFLAGLLALTWSADSDVSIKHLSGKDGFYAFSLSYGAGTWEEAAFRGWLMPMTREWMKSDFLSNSVTALVFAAAHYEKGFVPWPQFLSGLYFGHVTQLRNWNISESVFIHAWWDILIFTTSYASSRIIGKKQTMPPFYVPIFEARF